MLLQLLRWNGIWLPCICTYGVESCTGSPPSLPCLLPRTELMGEYQPGLISSSCKDVISLQMYIYFHETLHHIGLKPWASWLWLDWWSTREREKVQRKIETLVRLMGRQQPSIHSFSFHAHQETFSNKQKQPSWQGNHELSPMHSPTTKLTRGGSTEQREQQIVAAASVGRMYVCTCICTLL